MEDCQILLRLDKTLQQMTSSPTASSNDQLHFMGEARRVLTQMAQRQLSSGAMSRLLATNQKLLLRFYALVGA